jgi:hypothetical protein
MSAAALPRLPTVPRLSALIVACLAATWLIWGSTYLAIKWALVSLPPFFQMGTRFVAAALVLAAYAAWRGARWPDTRQWLSAAVLGALMVGGGYGFTALAQTHVSCRRRSSRSSTPPTARGRAGWRPPASCSGSWAWWHWCRARASLPHRPAG